MLSSISRLNRPSSIYSSFIQLLLIPLLLISSCNARVIRSSALLTCMDNSHFSANKFEVVFTPENRSVFFDIDAITTLEGYFVAQVTVVAYGIDVITRKVDFCNIGSESQQLCPISPGHISNLQGSQSLDEDTVSQIPGVAYTVPNLDGIVRVLVYANNSTPDNPVACVEATLSNDKTVQTGYASWTLAIVTIIGLLLAGLVWLMGNISSSAHIAANIVSLFVYFQSVAIIAMMAVDRCPPIAAAWSQNFMWTVGLISIPFMQDIFNWYVQSTGGTVTSILPNANLMSISIQKRDAMINQMAGLYRSISTDPVVKPFMLAASQLVPRDVAYFMQHENLRRAAALAVETASDSFRLIGRATSGSDTSASETTDEKLDDYSSKVLVLRGMQRVAFLANIEITSLFITGVTFIVIFTLFILIILLAIKVFTEILAKSNVIRHGRLADFRKSWRSIIKGVLLRICLMAFPSLTVLCLWELTQHESPATVIVAVSIYAVVLALLSFGAYKTISFARQSLRQHKNPAYILYSDPNILNRWGFLYVQFRATAYYFIVPLIIYIFLKGLFIAVIQSSGKVQSVCIFITELAYLIFLSWKKPYMDKTTNGFNIAIASINFVNALFFLFFSNIFGQPAYVSSIMAVVFFVANAAFSLVLLILIIVACLWAIFAKNPETRYQPMRDDRESFIPDPSGEKKPITELDALGASARDGLPENRESMTNFKGVTPTSVLDDQVSDGGPLSSQDTAYYRDDEMTSAYKSSNRLSTTSGDASITESSSNTGGSSSSGFPSARLPRSGAPSANGSGMHVQEYPGYSSSGQSQQTGTYPYGQVYNSMSYGGSNSNLYRETDSPTRPAFDASNTGYRGFA